MVLVDPRDQSERQRDRHRVVPTGFRFERARDAAADVRIAERREDGGGVGRRHDSAEQHRLEPRQVEELVRGHAGQECGDDDADRGEEDGGHCHLPQTSPRGREPAFIEDRREADDPDLARKACVVERDAADSL